jgi:hypothetical protein
VRAWHRTLAWGALPLVVAFSASGLFHLFVTSDLNAPPAPRAASFAVQALKATPRIEGVERAELTFTAGADGAPLARLSTDANPALYFDAAGAALALDDAGRARLLAAASADARVTPVTRFGDGYSFASKRLPVLRVGDGEAAVFVDPREGLVAARADRGLAAVEGWSFDVIHKWEPLAGAIGRRNRDYLTMAAVALIFATATFGLVLAVRRRRKTA